MDFPDSAAAAAATKSLQSCPTLCDPKDGSPRGSPVPGILQARTLEWGAICYSRESCQLRDRTASLVSPALASRFFMCWLLLLPLLSHFSRVRLCETPRRQPNRLPRPWDSPGKNTGLGCHFLFQCMKVKSEREVAQSCPTLSAPKY